MIGENLLLSLNRSGIFPGPNESDDAFFLRANALSANSSVDWIDISFGSKGLSFWEGAATWIEEREDGSRFCRIQLKDSFLTRLYPKEEIIAHEKIHAMRLMFDEKRFEEILAYQTSRNRFRRYFGPLFSSPLESRIFLILLMVSFLGFWAEIVFDWNLFAETLFIFPLVAMGVGIIRLSRSQRIFSRALNHLENALPPSAKPFELAVRMTDSEIELFAKSTPEQIHTFASTQQKTSLRWKQLFLAYF